MYKKIDITNIILKHLLCNISSDDKLLNILDKLNEHLKKFFHLYISYFCGRCEGKGHHKGIINNFLQSQSKSSEKMINKFFGDVEHGFFHGLMASFICYIINLDGNLVSKEKNLEQIFISATLHDFLKANGVEQKLHDKELRNVYSNLLEETYVHSDPPDKFSKKHLIVADRLELRRYPDYKNWVDSRFYELYEKMKPETREILNMFYENVRPAMEYLYSNKNDTFIRHGTEVQQEIIENIFPPSKTTYYSLTKKPDNLYPVEIDMVPFCSIINNNIVEGNKWHKDNQNGHCSNHDGMSQWNIIKGYISNSDFKKSGVLINTNKRDHLFAKSNIRTENWTFLYQNLDKPLNLENVTKDAKYLRSRTGINPFEYLILIIKNKK